MAFHVLVFVNIARHLYTTHNSRFHNYFGVLKQQKEKHHVQANSTFYTIHSHTCNMNALIPTHIKSMYTIISHLIINK